MTFVFSYHHYMPWKPFFLGMAECFPAHSPMGNGEFFFFSLFVCRTIDSPVKFFFTSTHEISSFYTSDFLLHPTVEGEQAIVWGKAASPELSHRHMQRTHALLWWHLMLVEASGC